MTSRWLISRPRALTASSVCSKVSTPAAMSAPYSPRLCPMTMSGFTPYASSRRVSARSAAMMAGWVISVSRSESSAVSIAVLSPRSTKMYSLSGRPSSGVMIASASSKVAATIGSISRSVASMFAYWDPWPVYRKATLAGAPRPRWMPRARSAFHMPAAFECSSTTSARAASPAFSARSAASV